MQWIKYQVGVLDSDRFRRCSPEAKLTFLVGLGYAGKLDSSGALYIQGWGPATGREIRVYTGLKAARQREALDELVKCGLFIFSEDCYSIAKWSEKAGDRSTAEAQRERQRRWRERRRDGPATSTATSTATPQRRKNDASRNASSGVSKATELELETPSPTETPSSSSPPDSLRSSSGDASGGTWQDQLRRAATAISARPIEAFTLDERQIAARYHCVAFGNCTKSEASNKARATEVAAAFASMGRHKTYGQITFSEYVAYARQVHQNRERKPWFDPWNIRSVVEFAESNVA